MMPKPLRKSFSVVDFQDGKPSKPVAEALRHSFGRGDQEGDIELEKSMSGIRHPYMNYPLANDILAGAEKREAAFKKGGTKQMNHVRGTDGWFASMLIIEDRAMDNYLYPFVVLMLNALLATLLSEIGGYHIRDTVRKDWDTVYAIVINGALAFLLVFRMNRCAVRFWEARTMWGDVSIHTRNLVGGILMYGSHSPHNRDMAIRWGSSFCVSAMHFIRSEHEYNPDELAGFISRDQISKLQDSNHAPLYTASMVRWYLRKIFKIDEQTPPQLAYAYAVQMNVLEQHVSMLVTQVSAMERIRSTPLPIAYVSHLRTFLYVYLLILPYASVEQWKWGTLVLVAFAGFALLGIEGASSEIEIPFDRKRPNHLALDAYCLIMLDSVQGLVVNDANFNMAGEQDNFNEDDPSENLELESSFDFEVSA